MALQDLTPQLRTRLRRVEWLVVLFLSGTVLLALTGFAWFIKSTGDARGWWVTQVPYYTYLSDGGTVKIGTPVKMMGFTIGEVVELNTTDDTEWNRAQNYNVFVRFLVRHPYQGYIFTDSYVKLGGLPIDFAGGSFLEVVRTSGKGFPTTTNLAQGQLALLWDKYSYNKDKTNVADFLRYSAFTKKDNGYFLTTIPSSDLIGELTTLLPKIREVFSHPGAIGNLLIPTNLAARIDRPGGLGDLLIPAQLNSSLTVTLTNLNRQLSGVGSLVAHLDQSVPPLVTHLDTTLPKLITQLNGTLPQLLTNLNTQLNGVGPLVSNLNNTLPAALTEVHRTLETVRSNTLPATEGVLNHTGDFMSGLKRHWLFRSAFKTNAVKSKLKGSVP